MSNVILTIISALLAVIGYGLNKFYEEVRDWRKEINSFVKNTDERLVRLETISEIK